MATCAKACTTNRHIQLNKESLIGRLDHKAVLSKKTQLVLLILKKEGDNQLSEWGGC